jgi:hypothetical protein
MTPLRLSVRPETFAICRLNPDAAIPDWASGSFLSITRTEEELSIVCPEAKTPANLNRQSGWRCLKVHGPLDSSATGVLSSLAAPLARAGISVFAISTYDTDYLLVKQEALDQALSVLTAHGHRVG